jgi:PAS domain S-box-containing protein
MLEQYSQIQYNEDHLMVLDALNLAKILEATPNEIYIFDSTTLQIEYANARALNNLGYSLEALQQMRVLDLKPELNAEQLQALVTPLVEHETTKINLETIHRRADGSTYPIEAHLQLVEETEKTRFFVIAVDISQRKNAENSLENKAKQLENIANNIPGAIYQIRYSPDGTPQVEYASDRAQEILEISLEEIYADFNKVLNLVHEEDRETLNEILKKNVTDEQPLFWEGRMITPSQRLVWVQARSQAQQQADGSVVRHGVFLDITAQKEAELALRESEEKFRQFAEHIKDAFWMVNPELTELIYASPSFETIWGRSREELRANPRNFFNWIHPADRAFVEQTILKPTWEEYDIQYRIIRPDGEVRWLRDRAFPIKNEIGEIYRIAGIDQDITEQKQAEVEISRNRKLREFIFEEATDALYLVDPDTLSILDCNHRGVELSGAKNKENLIQHNANCLLQKPFSEVKTRIQQIGVWQEEVSLKTLKGDEFWGDVAWKQIQVGEEIIYLVRVTDISEQKAFEYQLQTANECLELANQELAHSNHLKDQFLANMSHELKTPLNAILGISEGLQKGLFETISEEQKQVIKIIYTSAQHLLVLINEILDLAKIQAGKMNLNLTQVNLQSLCNSSLNLVREQASRKKIQLEVQFNTSFSTLNVDELRVRQILVNLLSNAVKFTPEEGKVTLSVTEDSLQGQIIFTVSDTGIGIPPENIKRLFEPFVQLDSELNRNYSGTGLGLSLVRHLSELHGGSVSVESEVDQGSRFSVRLPYTDTRLMSRQVDRSFSFHQLTDVSSSPLVLLINSNRAYLDTTASYLEASGYEVSSVSKKHQLLPLLRKGTPQVIVIDLQNFPSEGENIIQQLRDIPSLEQTPIIATISENAEYTEENILALGVTTCLIKPIRLRRLLNEIQRWLPEEFQQ